MTTPNDLPSVGTEDAREHVDEIVACLGDDAAMLLRLYGDGLDEVTENMDAAGTLITALVSERDELASRVRELERHNKALVERREWDVKDIKEYSAMVGRLEGVVSEFLEMVVSEFLEMVEEPPESNCSCHISPPCNDCVNHSGARSAFAAARAALNASKEHP